MAKAIATNLERITGVVIDKHAKSGPNWSRFRLETVEGRFVWATAKFGVEMGETIDAEATFNAKFRSYDVVKLVDDADGKVSNAVIILKLVDVLDGVGKVKARRLGEQFPELYDTLIEDPQAIADACGADLNKVIYVADALKAERGELSRVTTLVTRGFPHHLAKRIARDDRQYKTALESPYAAIKLVSGLGWLIADEIGRKQGIAADDVARIEAGIDYWYSEKVAGDGCTVVHVDRILSNENLPALLGISVSKIGPAVERVLLPLEDGYFTSALHRKNAVTISEFFVPAAKDGGEDTECAETENIS